MPNLANAKKALRQSAKRAARNLIVKNEYKKSMKAVRKGIEASEPDLTEKVRVAQKSLDKAAKRGVIKPNTAARKLSRMMTRVQLAKK